MVPEGIEAKLTEGRLSAHLATSVDDRPHVAPVWYTYADGVVSFLTGGKKLRNVRANPRVALSVEKADEAGVHWRIVLLGTAHVVGDRERVRAAAEDIYRRYYGPEATVGDGPLGTLVEVRVGSADLEGY
jgi:nitroimidazol reductase NimA-like FMN-containing flavoprotein (pyridoxamine 5'-phosphate oxidase superfamily)